MALINCPECDNQVSSTAATCPNCGAPIAIASEAAAAGATLTTTQGTSKKLKLQSALSATLFWIGLVGSIVAVQALPTGEPSMFYWVLLVGIVWYSINKARIWWHHD